MRTRTLLALCLTLAVALAAAGPAAARPAKVLHYQGKTKEGTKISFIVNRKGWIDQLDMHMTLPATCISAQGGTRVQLEVWEAPYMWKLGTRGAVKTGDPTTNYHLQTRRGKGHRVIGKASMNWSELGMDDWGNYKIWHCLATANFSLKPHK